ncbi:MAG: hypothetical protein ABSG57_09665 [Candidatus Bathyarchaeia archaeon]
MVQSKLHYVIIALAVAMLVCTAGSTSIHSMDSSGFGLVSRLPIYFWVGLVLVCFLWYLGRRSKTTLIAALVLTLSFLFIAPAIVRVPVWLSNSYYPFAESSLIDTSGHLVDRPLLPSFSYHDWPMFLYLASILTIVTEAPDYLLLKLFPLITVCAYGLLAFLVLKSRLKTEHAILGAGWVLATYWLRQQYFGPQGVAYILFLLAFLLITWIFFDEKARKKELLALFFCVFSILTLMHVLSAFMVITLLVALYVSQRFLTKKLDSNVAKLVLFSIVFFLACNIYFAGDFFQFAVQRMYQSLLGIGGHSFLSETTRVIGSRANQVSYFSSWGSVFISAGIAFLSLILVGRKILPRRQFAKEGYAIFCGISLVLFAVYGVVLQYGLSEAYQRAFMFGLVPLAFLCIYVLKDRPKLLVGLLAVLIFLNIPAQYGSDSFRLSTNQELAGSRFFATYSPQKSTCFDEFSLYIRYYNSTKIYQFTTIVASAPSVKKLNQTSVDQELARLDYVVRSGLENNYYLFYYGSNPLSGANLDRFNKVYDNGAYEIFSNNNVTVG